MPKQIFVNFQKEHEILKHLEKQRKSVFCMDKTNVSFNSNGDHIESMLVKYWENVQLNRNLNTKTHFSAAKEIMPEQSVAFCFFDPKYLFFFPEKVQKYRKIRILRQPINFQWSKTLRQSFEAPFRKIREITF